MSQARDAPPFRTLGALFLVVLAVAGTLLFLQFRGDFRHDAALTLISPRAGLVVEPGAKVTFNGVEIGRVAGIDQSAAGETPQARIAVQVDPRALAVIPANAVAEIRATTVFGNKYVSLSSPETPAAQHLSPGDELDVATVTTEFNTLFETVTAIAEQVDPVKLNQTLSATATALNGLGDRFGASLQNGNRILDDLNPRMRQLHSDVIALARLADVYSDASEDLWDGLGSAVVTARTLSARAGDVDAALMAAVGFAEPATDAITRGAPYLVRGAADLLPTSKLLDDYRGMIFCTTRN